MTPEDGLAPMSLDGITVKPIWDGKRKIEHGKQETRAPGDLLPFDSSRFF